MEAGSAPLPLVYVDCPNSSDTLGWIYGISVRTFRTPCPKLSDTLVGNCPGFSDTLSEELGRGFVFSDFHFR